MKKFLCLILLLLTSLSHAALSEKSVKSINGKSGFISQLAKTDVGLINAVETLVIVHTFTAEHSTNDVETIGTLPANARILGGGYSFDNQNYTWADPDAGSFDIGFTGLSDDISGFTPLIPGDTVTYAIAKALHKKFGTAKDVILTHKANTVNMTGVPIIVSIMYLQE